MNSIREAMLRAWCKYRNMEYVEGHVCPLPSDNFENGFIAGGEYTKAIAGLFIPYSIVGMMKERGYTGSDNVGYYEAKKWLCKKYNAWLLEIPRYLTPIDLNSEYLDAPYDHKVLMWEVVARDITSWMPGDYYCRYFAIHQEDNTTEQALEDADVFGVEVCEDSGKYYKSPEDAICAGLIRAMLWLS